MDRKVKVAKQLAEEQKKAENEMMDREMEMLSHQKGSTDKQSILNDLKQADKIKRTVFHKCCLDQNPRLLNLNLKKIQMNTLI